MTSGLHWARWIDQKQSHNLWSILLLFKWFFTDLDNGHHEPLCDFYFDQERQYLLLQSIAQPHFGSTRALLEWNQFFWIWILNEIDLKVRVIFHKSFELGKRWPPSQHVLVIWIGKRYNWLISNEPIFWFYIFHANLLNTKSLVCIPFIICNKSLADFELIFRCSLAFYAQCSLIHTFGNII